MLRRVMQVVAIVGCCVCSAVAISTASAKPRTPSPPAKSQRVKVAFRSFETNVRDFAVDGRYLVTENDIVSTGASDVTLIDDETGEQTPGPTDCEGPLLGGKWLTFTGNLGADPLPCTQFLFPLAGGSPTPRVPSVAVGIGHVGTAIGSDWMEVDTNCDDIHTCPSWSYENLATGAVEPNPTNSRTVPDLNAPELGHQICAPLRVPSNHRIEPSALIRQAGRFVLAAGVTNQFLEKCGTHMHVRLVGAGSDPVAFTRKVVLWQTAGRTVSGLLLPSLKPIQIRLPGNQSFAIAIGPRHIYALGNDRLWIAPVPKIFAGATTLSGCSGPGDCAS
jgi:hypothetical protein